MTDIVNAGYASIATKIAAIMGELETIPRRGDFTMNGKSQYTYATADDVNAIIRKLLAKYKLVIIPRIKEITHIKDTNAKGNTYHQIISTYEFEILDGDTGGSIVGGDASMAIDNGDKAQNKNSTTVQKYFLRKLFHLDTGDPENDLSEERSVEKNPTGLIEKITRKVNGSNVTYFDVVTTDGIEVKIIPTKARFDITADLKTSFEEMALEVTEKLAEDIPLKVEYTFVKANNINLATRVFI